MELPGFPFSSGTLIAIVALSIPLVAIIGWTAVSILRVIFGIGKISRRSDLADGEAQLIQEIHNGLLRMEERVEALETILLDRERGAKKRSQQ
jgi:phage shock protein B